MLLKIGGKKAAISGLQSFSREEARSTSMLQIFVAQSEQRPILVHVSAWPQGVKQFVHVNGSRTEQLFLALRKRLVRCWPEDWRVFNPSRNGKAGNQAARQRDVSPSCSNTHV